jgi:alkylhydroperoxidase family enzyme
MLAHGSILMKQFMEPGEVRALADDFAAAELDPVDLAIMELADKVARDATSVGEEDLARLRSLGLTDAEIMDVVLAAAARCFFSKTLDALGVQPDAKFAALDDDVRDALVVGRPIATS